MFKYLCAVVATVVILSSCKDDTPRDYQSYVNDPLLYCKTVKALNNVVLENNFPPMIASRNYVYANIAAYEIVAAFDNRFQSLAGQIKHLPAVPKFDTTNVDYHLAALFAFCKTGEAVTFPEGSMKEYVAKLEHDADSAGVSADVIKASRLFADSVAGHVLKWSKGDNYLQLRTAPKFTITTEEGRWVPTPPMYAQAIEPYWKQMRTMVIDSCAQFRPPGPPKFDPLNKNSTYYKAMMEVKNISDSLTAEQKHIADFWDDNPFKMNVIGHVNYATKKFSPAGHWMNIVGIAAQKANADFSTTVAAYAETAIALYEAFIICWDEKFRSNFIRPESAINIYLGKETAGGWAPYIQTPPFPSYTSGHATISAAAAESMTKWFGNNLSFTDTSLLEFGIRSRPVNSFREAAKEAAMSRLYGGIHYRFDNDDGNKAGTVLGDYIVQRLKMKK